MGTCVNETACTPVPITNAGTTSMTGTTCSGEVYGNLYPTGKSSLELKPIFSRFSHDFIRKKD